MEQINKVDYTLCWKVEQKRCQTKRTSAAKQYKEQSEKLMCMEKLHMYLLYGMPLEEVSGSKAEFWSYQSDTQWPQSKTIRTKKILG